MWIILENFFLKLVKYNSIGSKGLCWRLLIAFKYSWIFYCWKSFRRTISFGQLSLRVLLPVATFHNSKNREANHWLSIFLSFDENLINWKFVTKLSKSFFSFKTILNFSGKPSLTVWVTVWSFRQDFSAFVIQFEKLTEKKDFFWIVNVSNNKEKSRSL